MAIMDRGQNVVQVVGNATSQGSDAFHALRAQELSFDLLPFRDVSIDGEERFGSPLVVANQGPARFDGNLTPTLGQMLNFALPFAATDRQSVDFFKLF
jgi:hypothetical protein